MGNLKHKMILMSISFLIGVVVASFILSTFVALLSIIILTVIFLIYYSGKSNRIFLIILLLLCLSSMLEYTILNNKKSKLDTYIGKPIIIQCVIVDKANNKDAYTELKAKYIVIIDKNFTYCNENIILRYRGKNNYEFGDLVKITGDVKDFSGKRNYGDFDFKKYFKSKKISKIVNIKDIKLISKNNNNFMLTFLFKSKEKVRRIIYDILPKEQSSILFGMLTGDKEDIEKSTLEGFKKTGIAHILSVSGLHIGFVLLLLRLVLKPLKLSNKSKYAIIIFILTYYVFIIGAPVSAVRAFIMLVVLIVGKLLNRDYSLLSSASFAMLIMLIINPLVIHEPGFVISFACVYSIGGLYEFVYNKLKNIHRYIREPLAISLSVWLGITPVLAYYFNYISFGSIFLNILAVPITFFITAIGFVGVIVGSINSLLATYVFSLDFYTIKAFTYITELASEIPFIGMNIPRLPLHIYVIYYLVLVYIVFLSKSILLRNYRKHSIYVCTTALLMVTLLNIMPSSFLRVIFLDVGQGDSSCIITPSKKVILVDGGGGYKKSKYYYNVGKNITVPALLNLGVWSIDTVVVTHAHDDHMEGLLEVINTFKVNNIIFPDVEYDNSDISKNYNELINLCKNKGVKVAYLNKGDVVEVDKDISMEIIHPNLRLIKGTVSDINNNSLVFKLSYRKFEAIYTGDIEHDAERQLTLESMECDVLKVPHHGSKSSSTNNFINNVRPKYCIISVGKNSFGHPDKEVVSRLEDISNKVFRTDKNGAVQIRTDGKSMFVDTIR